MKNSILNLLAISAAIGVSYPEYSLDKSCEKTQNDLDKIEKAKLKRERKKLNKTKAPW